MDRVVLINLLYIATERVAPLDFIAWLPIVLRPVPILSAAAHFCLVLTTGIFIATAKSELNLIVAVALVLAAPLVGPKPKQSDDDRVKHEH